MTTIILPAGASRSTVRAYLDGQLNQLNQGLDWIVTIEERGKSRSLEQNRLQQLWHLEAAQQLRDEDAEDKRAYCKLHFGVPILRAESETFRAEYDRVVRPLDYATKLALMKTPFDFPVSRLMTVKQTTQFLDAVYQHYTSQGVRLSHPDDLGRSAWNKETT